MPKLSTIRPLLLAFAAFLPLASAAGQGRIADMPGYDRYTEMMPKIREAMVSGAIGRTEWADDSRSFTYTFDGKFWRYDVRKKSAVEEEQTEGSGDFRRGRGGVARGRQATEAYTADSLRRAFYRDRNLWVSNADGTNERPLTNDGSEELRIKYGTASWVYGEELSQRSAMWWSPDGSKIAYYRFDEMPVRDYYLQTGQTTVEGSVEVEAYPKAGTDNPIVDLYVYDLEADVSRKLDIRMGQPFQDDVVGYYAYSVSWSPDGSELLLNRTNRRQNVMEFTACSPADGSCRVVVREEWPASWTDNRPTMQWLEDGKRFIWQSERTGFANYYLYDLSGELLATLTNHPFEVGGIVKVDERAKQLWYYARSGDNYMKLQLHRVGLDGRGDTRLTDPAFNHTVTVSPDGKLFTDVSQTHAIPPVTRLRDARGRERAVVAESNMTGVEELGLTPVEMFNYTSADGKTELQGMMHKPSNFDPTHQYPVLFSVYLGPGNTGARETYSLPHPYTEYGFIIVTIDTRAASGKGKKSLDQIYLKLGEVEIDDAAAASRELAKLPYVDGDRVGIFGTSYGGYASALALLRHPEAFAAASAASAVTSWHHYDTIYTERYMYTPQANPDGYEKGNAMSYAKDLEGDLMIYYGTADDNVHPNNSMMLIKALQDAGKSFEVQVGPDRGHSGINPQRMMEFFIQSLVMKEKEVVGM
ncbi:MAG: DPP IV N-terminal domain-containing protein [Rhodothermales bacterium]